MSVNEGVVVSYRVDASQSKFTVQAFAAGLLSGFGHNPTIAIGDFSGAVQFVPDSFADASLRLVMKADSLALLDEVKESDRLEIERAMFTQVLESRRYPEMVFQSRNITMTQSSENRYRARIIGDLTFHGVTRQGVWIQAKIATSAETLQAQGEFTLKQTDFQIKPVSFAAGALKLKDELKFSFDIFARREEG